MTLKIAVVGPESTGKTSLSKKLSDHFKVPYVEEYAVRYLDGLGRDYGQADLLEIAKGQFDLEDQHLQQNPRLLICDTNLVVIKIWSDFKYESCDPRIVEMMLARSYDLHLLMKPDLDWEPAKFRENPHDLDILYKLYHEELVGQGVNFIEVGGQGAARYDVALEALNRLLIA